MKRQTERVTEMVAGVIAVMTLAAESDKFSFRHSIIGILLALFIVRGFWQSKTFYESLLFAAIFALAALLAFGKLIDFVRDTDFFRLKVDRDFAYFWLWLSLTGWVLAIDLLLENRRVKRRIGAESNRKQKAMSEPTEQKGGEI